MTTDAAVAVRGVSKRYPGVLALDGVSFDIAAGEILGVLGPNGAGKTTLVECMGGSRRPDCGTVRVRGLDPWRDAYALRRCVGVQLQHAALQERMTVAEALDLFASLYREPADWRALLEEVDLSESANVMFGRLSAGQKQRVLVALALINHPAVVFFDELTSALDPHARRAIWGLVRRVRDRGATVVLTTHFMDEAERLCDRIAVMRSGRIVALDSPERLIRRFHPTSARVNLEDVFLVLTGGSPEDSCAEC